MCAFCNTGLACVEKREGVFYDCNSSTSGRRLLILNALRGGPTLQGDFLTLCKLDQSQVELIRISSVSARVQLAMGGS